MIVMMINILPSIRPTWPVKDITKQNLPTEVLLNVFFHWVDSFCTR
jgi:hypothetical protein